MLSFKEIWEKIKSLDIQSIHLQDILSGYVTSNPAFRRQGKLLLLCFLLTLFYIGNRYAAEQQQIEAARLETNLQDLKYRSLNISAELMTMSRRSNIQKEIQRRGIDLNQSKTPPIIVK